MPIDDIHEDDRDADQQEQAPEPPEQPAREDGEQPAPGDHSDEDDHEDDEQDGDTFPRPYVERLRARSAGYRTRANTAEARATELEGALFTERVRALDVLADPTDLPYDPEALDDPDALRAAVDELVSKRPHLRRRGVAGAGAGTREQDDGTEPVSLLGIMRGGA